MKGKEKKEERKEENEGRKEGRKEEGESIKGIKGLERERRWRV